MDFLPSKKIIVLLLFTAALITGTIFALKPIKKPEAITVTRGGLVPTASTTADLLEQAVTADLESGKKYTTFDEATLSKNAISKDLIIANKENPESIKAYALTIVTILKPYEISRENEARVLLKALDYRNTEQFTRLKNIATLHKLTVDKLLHVTIPKSAVPYHLELVNSLRRLAILVDNMSQGLSQPVLALESARTYIDENPNFFIAINDLNEYFTLKKLQFEDSEKINVFMNLDE